MLVNVCGKTGQLSSVVSSLCSIQPMVLAEEPLHKEHQKPAAWTSLPVKEGHPRICRPVQSANICLLCCHLYWHNSAVYVLISKEFARDWPSLAP